MKIVEHRDHPCKKWAERRVGKNLDDEVNVECVENEGAVIHVEKQEGNAAPPARCRNRFAVNLCKIPGTCGDGKTKRDVDDGGMCTT